jgi:hypothetical protein
MEQNILEVTKNLRTDLDAKAKEIISESIKTCTSVIKGMRYDESSAKAIKMYMDNEYLINDSMDVCYTTHDLADGKDRTRTH